MPTIQRLSTHEAHKIAAGQVIERPADIIKELVENAIDAAATTVTIYVEDAGKTVIRVIDNGCGMDTTDAQLCFEKHATSKLQTLDQLNTIATFGFRGEAMPSIAAVCKVTLITRQRDALEGVRVCVTENVIQSVEPTAAAVGTDISARDLFYTMPVRKKFLKKTDTEWRHIVQLIQAFCLDYPHIQFTLTSDNKQLLHCPAVEVITDRFAQLWDHTVSRHMLTIHATKDSNNMTISGAICDHQQFRFDRNGIFIFVNNRWIKNFTLTNAFIKGYMNVAPDGRYPIGCINLTIDPTLVDINIHPRKEEVRFVHPLIVEHFIRDTVKQRLEQHIAESIQSHTSPAFPQSDQVPSWTQTQKSVHTALGQQPVIESKSSPYIPFNFDVSSHDIKPDTMTTSSATTNPWFSDNNTHKPQSMLEYATAGTEYVYNQTIDHKTEESSTIIGQFNNTYIIIEKDNGLFLVDQHAAHERVWYERFIQRSQQTAIVSLVFPQLISISHNDMDTINPHLTLLNDCGIHIEQFGSNQLKITALPIPIKNIAMIELIQQILGWIHDNGTLVPQEFANTLHEKICAQMACKAAVKAGDVLTTQQMRQLLDDLQKVDNRLTCPHGRPTGWLLTLHEIEKKFKRTT